MILKLENITKYYGELLVFRDINFSIFQGDIAAVIGTNASGKTTLVNIITKETMPDEGMVEYAGGTRIGLLKQLKIPQHNIGIIDYIKQDLGLGDENLNDISIDEYIEKELYDIDTRIEKVLSGLGFKKEEFSKPVLTLSKGQFRRVLFAVLLLRDDDLLVLDEPTNHLDIESIEWLENYLKATRKTVVFVSHDKCFIDKIATRILLIHQKGLYSFNGNWASFEEQWEHLKTTTDRQHEKYEKRKVKLEAFVRKHIAGQKTKQAQSRRKQLIKLEEVKTIKEAYGVNFKFNNIDHNPGVIASFEKVSFGFPSNRLFMNVSFGIYRNDRVGIIGRNGSGKTSMLNLILGKILPDNGEVFLNKNIEYFYLSQDPNVEYDALVLIEIISYYSPGMTKNEIMDLLGAYGLADKSNNKFQTLSGGEKRRLQLAISQIGTYKLLVLDEPTNHLDIFSIENLVKGLNDYNGCCIFVTHNRYFLEAVATKIIEIEDQRTTVYHGNYSYYREKKVLAQENSVNTVDQSIKKKQARPGLSKNQIHKMKLKQEEIEKEISICEEQRDLIINNEFSNPDNFKEKEKYMEIRNRLAEIEKKLECLMEALENILQELEQG